MEGEPVTEETFRESRHGEIVRVIKTAGGSNRVLVELVDPSKTIPGVGTRWWVEKDGLMPPSYEEQA